MKESNVVGGGVEKKVPPSFFLEQPSAFKLLLCHMFALLSYRLHFMLGFTFCTNTVSGKVKHHR